MTMLNDFLSTSATWGVLLTLFGVSMLNTRIHGAVGEVQDKVRRRRES